MSIKIAFAGTGYIAAVHARAAQQAGAQLAAVITDRQDLAEEFTARFHIPAAYPTLEAMLQAGKVDALVVCTPNVHHAPISTAALKQGVHVLLEKPMAMNASEAQEILTASRDSGAALMVGHCWRFDNEVNWLKEHTQSGQIGRIVRTKGYGVHTAWGPSGWFSEKKLAGGGALIDMGIHAIDTARDLLGDPQPTSVYARLATNYIEGDVDDTGVLIITWDGGAVSYVESGWWQPHADGPEAATQLYGTGGFGAVFPTRLILTRPEKKGQELVSPDYLHPRSDHSPQEMYDRQMACFLDCIRTRRTPSPGGEEGLVNMKIIDAAYLSSQSGKAINL